MTSMNKINSQINKWKTYFTKLFGNYSNLFQLYIYYATLFSTLHWERVNLEPCAWPHTRSVTGYGFITPTRDMPEPMRLRDFSQRRDRKKDSDMMIHSL